MEKIREKIGFIGIGNMGASILEGLLTKGLVQPKQVWIYDKATQKVDELATKLEVNRAISITDLLMCTQAVIVAVKPQDFSPIAEEFKAGLKAKHTLISILAGTPVAKIQGLVGTVAKTVRAMPNLGAKVGHSMTALTAGDAEALALAGKIFSGCGKTVNLEESFFDLVTAVSGSGPAYFFLMMELLAAEGVRQGLSEAVARLLAVETAVGAALAAQAETVSPAQLRERVTSKGGTTAAALKVLEEGNFAALFSKALEAAVARSRELAK